MQLSVVLVGGSAREDESDESVTSELVVGGRGGKLGGGRWQVVVGDGKWQVGGWEVASWGIDSTPGVRAVRPFSE